MLLSKLKLFFVSLLLFFAFAANADKAPPLQFSALQVAPPLDEKQGFVLVDLDVGGKAPSIEFVKLRYSKKAKEGEKQKYDRSTDNRVISLKNLDNGLNVLALPPGLYQVIKVNAPFFDLPYILDTKSKKSWRFRVQSGAVNYIGRMVIEQERGKDFINVDLLKRFATNQTQIEQAVTEYFPALDLKMGFGQRDDFNDYFQGLQSAGEVK